MSSTGRPSSSGQSTTSAQTNISHDRFPPSYTLPPLPPSTDSLTSGTSIPAPATQSPIPPPKDLAPAPMPPPITPQRKPVLRQKSPLSNEYPFGSPASSMPGAFPTTPPAVGTPNAGLQNTQFHTAAYASTSLSRSSTPNSKSPKRPGSIRNLFSFKSLRRSSDNMSPDSQCARPETPSGESTISSSRPSFASKMSGGFWKRKSSLGMNFGSGDADGRASTSAGLYVDKKLVEERGETARSPTPVSGSEFPTMKKRKSGTFWRRRSSMGLASAFGDSETGTGAGQNVTANETPNGAMNGRQTGAMNGGDNVPTNKEKNGTNGYGARKGGGNVTMGEQDDEKLSPESTQEPPRRSFSPAPQLPDFVGGGIGLGGEDLFKDIY